MWAQDLTREYTIFEAGLDRFVHLDKGEFIGRDALVAQLERGVPQRFVALEIFGIKDADAIGNEPIFDQSGEMVGRVTAGAYGHWTQKALAQGYVKSDYCEIGTQLRVKILGEDYQAEIIPESPYDPENVSLRA
nr:glycine cleavage T C-terminal barrel domain-containing protein [Sneathiella glossodoripedis]